MKLRIPIGYKFIFGFLAVVAVAAFVPEIIDQFDILEWLKKPLSFLVAMLIGLILGMVFSRGLTRRFSLLSAHAQRISQGDLTYILRPGTQLFRDESAELEESISVMSDNLRGLVEHMTETVANLTETQDMFASVVSKGEETAKDVSHGAKSIYDGAVVQYNHMANATGAVNLMAEIADEVATKVTDNANASQKANSMVQRGATTATSAMEKMETMFKGVENTELVAMRLKEKINDIPKILDVITHISRQTDLLALNATIEASKAGEHGRGFAMVAEEVRRFADNTNASVQDVSLIVKELKIEVERVVQSASEGTSYLTEGRDDLRKIREILVDITNYTSEVAERGTAILSLTHKQKDKAEKAVGIIGEVADIAKENLGSAEKVGSTVSRLDKTIEETIAASRKLAALSVELKAVVAKFTL